jgi:2-polyprenyl-3-methyl-5-hydroxy-6-metoxy-1,4-benzoquinol methylase
MERPLDRYYEEVSRGKRFEFGRNWARFLRVLDDRRIAIAEQSLKTMLEVDNLAGKSFLDIGSGSGLFSLAARRCGAMVHSFDYDPQSVSCTRELKRRYFPEDSKWTVERGSVLDRAYLDKLGAFDIVYSWGVLHHTGRMWEALDNVKPLVRMGGCLFIAIYNDQGEVTDRWARVKERFNSLPRPLARLYALKIIAAEERKSVAGHLRTGGIGNWLKSWSEYDSNSARGMSRWHDWIDWIGGLPYERASIETVVDRFAGDGFRLVNLFDRSNGYGCNEFVFSRDAPLGTPVQSLIPVGTSVARRYGTRVTGPFELTSAGWIGHLLRPPTVPEGASLLLFKDRDLVGPAKAVEPGRVVIGTPQEETATIEGSAFRVLSAFVRKPAGPFANLRGHMWRWEAGDLEPTADNMDTPCRSTVCVFENGRQLPFAHSLHEDIARVGKGRFSHWGREIYFAPLSNSDPNDDPDRFALVIPVEPA